MTLTVLSSPGVNIMRMYSAEGRDERLVHIRHTSCIILYIYLGYTALSIVLFKLAGMPVFDSVFYAFSALQQEDLHFKMPDSYLQQRMDRLQYLSGS